MKKYFLSFIISLLWLGYVNGQEYKDYSVEISSFYINYYNKDNNWHNEHNSGVSVLFSRQINSKWKLGLGYGNYSKNTYYISSPSATGSTEKWEYLIKNCFIPVLAEYKLYNANKFNISIVSGILFTRFTSYRVNWYLPNTSPLYNVDYKVDPKFGMMYRFGLNLSREFGSRIKLNIAPYFNLKFVQDFAVYYHGQDFSYDCFSYGVSVALEYKFKSKNHHIIRKFLNQGK